MRVNDVEPPDQAVQLENRCHRVCATESEPVSLKSFAACKCFQPASRRTNNRLAVSAVPKAARQRQKLPLAAAHLMAGVKMEDSKHGKD